MVLRAALFSLAVAALALHTSPSAAKDAQATIGYPGPALPDSAVGKLRLASADWLQVDSIKVKRGRSLAVLPGTHMVRWGGKVFTGGISLDRHERSAGILIEAGHSYAAHAKSDGRVPYLWIEDASSGSVVAGARKRSANRDPLTLFIQAAERGELDAVREALAKGVNVNGLGAYNQTALHRASRMNHVSVMALLIKHGAEVNALDVSERTALIFAAAYADTAAVGLLLAHGADPNLARYGPTALMAAAAGRAPRNMRRLLAHSGTEVNARTTLGETALMYAAQQGEEDGIRVLLEQGAEVNARDMQGKTALDWANKKEAKALLREHGAKPGSEL